MKILSIKKHLFNLINNLQLKNFNIDDNYCNFIEKIILTRGQ